MPAGSWTLTEELFTRGDAAFVVELRQTHAPEQLGAFSAKWIADPRPFARQALLEYLSLPLNCYRHEPLVKRLFKLAEAAGDDELMGAFLVAVDRSIRRVRRRTVSSKSGRFKSRAEAEAAIREWENLGFRNASVNSFRRGEFFAFASQPVEVVDNPLNKMPRPKDERRQKRAETLTESAKKRMERRGYVLFSLPTRRYLRRRAWRYFRLIGKKDPQRYVQAAVKFLVRYRDEDVDSDIHLLDNWGLTHALFGHCPALIRPATGWKFLPGKGLADLAFAPRCESAWLVGPARLTALALEAQCRTVRLFAVRTLQTKLGDDWWRQIPLTDSLRLADHADPDVSSLGFDLLARQDWSAVPVGDWLRRLDGDDPEKVGRFANFLAERWDTSQLSLADMIRLATHRNQSLAAIGFFAVQMRSPSRAELPVLLGLVRAECDDLRPVITQWLLKQFNETGPVEPGWILELLDAPHEDVRQAGWDWFLASNLRTDTSLWQQLMESPYDDVRGRLTTMLSEVLESTDTTTLGFLWAGVLCAIHRHGRQKPGVVAQIVARIRRDPADAPEVLPLLAVAVRSLRGPEFRAGLAGVVMLAQTTPELGPLIARQFPELTM